MSAVHVTGQGELPDVCAMVATAQPLVRFLARSRSSATKVGVFRQQIDIIGASLCRW